jgi:hypothetical protein
MMYIKQFYILCADKNNEEVELEVTSPVGDEPSYDVATPTTSLGRIEKVHDGFRFNAALTRNFLKEKTFEQAFRVFLSQRELTPKGKPYRYDLVKEKTTVSFP